MSTFVRTFKRRKIFLDSLAAGDSTSKAARNAGGTTSNFKAWEKSDPNFAADMAEAIEEGTDFIEDVATDRAIAKSDPLMLAILKARRPEKYDRGGRLELTGSLNLEGSKAKLLNKIARLQAAGTLPSPSPESELPVSKQEEKNKVLSLPSPGGDTPIRGRKRRAAAEGSRRETTS